MSPEVGAGHLLAAFEWEWDNGPWVSAHGAEFGVRTVALRGLQTTATVWYLGFDSELIYVGDSGSTEAGPATRRTGVEITNYIYPRSWLNMDLDLSFSRARFVDVPAGQNYVTGALNRVISGGSYAHTFQVLSATIAALPQ